MMALMRGDITPDRTIAVEWMAYDIWAEMRALDTRLSSEVLGPLEDFMAAQTEDTRLKKMTMGEYLEWRGRDVGASYVQRHASFRQSFAVTDMATITDWSRHWGGFPWGSSCRRKT